MCLLPLSRPDPPPATAGAGRGARAGAGGSRRAGALGARPGSAAARRTLAARPAPAVVPPSLASWPTVPARTGTATRFVPSRLSRNARSTDTKFARLHDHWALLLPCAKDRYPKVGDTAWWLRSARLGGLEPGPKGRAINFVSQRSRVFAQQVGKKQWHALLKKTSRYFLRDIGLDLQTIRRRLEISRLKMCIRRLDKLFQVGRGWKSVSPLSL